MVILSNKVMWGNYCIIILSRTPKDAIAQSKKSRINPDRLDDGGGFYSDY